MRVSTNTNSSVAIRKLQSVNRELDKQTDALSTGSRISKAAYDPAGLAISEGMRSRIRGMGQVKRNINDGISFFQLAEGNFETLQGNAVRMKELAMQASSDTFGDEERKIIQQEFDSVKSEIQRVTKGSVFNIFGGKERKESYDIQIGLNNSSNEDRLSYDVREFFDFDNFYGTNSMDVSNSVGARGTLSKVDQMISKLAAGRATLGSYHAKLNAAFENVENSNINLQASNSMIRDTDVAESSARHVIEKMKISAASTMLGQANSNPKTVLNLV